MTLESGTALTTGNTVSVVSHEDTSAADGALTSEVSDLTGLVDLVVLKNGELHLLVNVSNLLRLGVSLLLVLLTTTTKSEDEVKGRLLLNVVVAKGSAVLELLTSEDESLLIRGDTLLVLDLGLDIIDSVGSLDI